MVRVLENVDLRLLQIILLNAKVIIDGAVKFSDGILILDRVDLQRIRGRAICSKSCPLLRHEAVSFAMV